MCITGALKGKRAPDFLEPVLQAAVSHLMWGCGIELRSFAVAVALNQ